MNNTERGVEVIGKVIRAICKRPRELVITREDTAGNVELAIEANPADTRRLVGRGGKTLESLRFICEAMSDGDRGLCEKRIAIANPIQPNENEQHPAEPFVVDPRWPRGFVEGMIREILELAYGVPAKVLTVQHQPYAVKVYGIPQTDLAGVEGFGKMDRALETVFVPIGTNVGMRIYAHVRDWRDTSKVRVVA